MTKKILVVDDSALMRRVLCDIINSDKRFQVVAKATNGLEAFDLLSRNTYDAVVLDVNMPKMNGIELLEELRKYKISREKILAERQTVGRMVDIVKRHVAGTAGEKIVAIASSTGGPKALQMVVPELPAELDAPVLIVQHMPKGFTASFAERLDSLSPIAVKEAEDGEELRKGQVYIARGGSHMKVKKTAAGKYEIQYTDEPNREGVKPCANYMFESLMDSRFDNVVCVVMTGMGADGTEGIRNLKTKKKVHVIAQDQNSCTVYGMPKSVANAGLTDQVVPLEQIAQEIILNVGVVTK